MAKFLLVGLGGFLGATARYGIGAYVGNRFGGRFPFGTFAINMSGCFLIGIVLTLLDQRAHPDSAWRFLVPIGFIGAYTTFSTFEYETLRSVQNGAFTTAALNVVLSVVLGFAFVWLGMVTGHSALSLAKRTAMVHVPELTEQQQFLPEAEG